MTERLKGRVATARNGHNRRDVLKSAASAGLVSLVAAPAGSRASVPAPPAASLYKIAFDDRHPAGRAFGKSMAAAGYNTIALGDDVTDFWYHDLHQRWRKGPAAIAGLTSLRAAFCLEGLAGDVWMRPVYRGEHNFVDGAWRHRLQGRGAAADPALLDGPADHWAAGLSRIVRAAEHETSPVKRLSAAAAPSTSGAAEPLISWLITPSHRS